MRKKVFGKQLKRGTGSRRALFVALVRSLVKFERIETTRAKAKAIVGDLDNIVNLAKDGSIQSLRRLYAMLGNDKESTQKLSKELAPRMKSRKSGYVRIIKLSSRRGDSAEMVRLEWVFDAVDKKETGRKVDAKGVKVKKTKSK